MRCGEAGEGLAGAPAALHLRADGARSRRTRSLKRARAIASSVSDMRRFSSILSSSEPRTCAMAALLREGREGDLV